MDDQLIVKKLCNCLVPEAEVDLSSYSLALAVVGVEAESIEAAVDRFRRLYGGLWVGGSAILTTTTLSFLPNKLNRKVHRGDCSFSVPLSEIRAVDYERGFVTGIVVVTTERGSFKLRCYGARGFQRRIEEARSG